MSHERPHPTSQRQHDLLGVQDLVIVHPLAERDESGGISRYNICPCISKGGKNCRPSLCRVCNSRQDVNRPGFIDDHPIISPDSERGFTDLIGSDFHD